MKRGKHGEIRRASIKTPATYAEFEAKMTEVFGPLPEGARLKFEDDEGDLVTLSNQSDLEEALRVVASSDAKILRLVVLQRKPDVPEGQEGSCPRRRGFHHGGEFHHQRRSEEGEGERRCPRFGGDATSPFAPFLQLLDTAKASLPELLSNPALRSMAEGLIQSHMIKIVQPYRCDSCNCSIAGDRFHSSTDSNFDLCKACFDAPVGQALNKQHNFTRVSALDALVQILQNGGSFDSFFESGPATAEPVQRHHAFCDRCNSNIVGIRHKCLDCPDYDECNTCKLSGGVPHVEGHVFHAMHDASVRVLPADVVLQHATMRNAEKQKRDEEARARAAAEAEAEAVRARAAAVEAEAARVRAEAEAARAASVVSAPVKLVPAPVAVAAAPEAEEVKGSEREPSAFERNLATLEAMGFSDRKKAIQVLVRNRNKLFESIQELLN